MCPFRSRNGTVVWLSPRAARSAESKGRLRPEPEDDIRTAYELGANSYVVKPLESEKFAAAVGEIGLYWLGRNEPPS